MNCPFLCGIYQYHCIMSTHRTYHHGQEFIHQVRVLDAEIAEHEENVALDRGVIDVSLLVQLTRKDIETILGKTLITKAKLAETDKAESSGCLRCWCRGGFVNRRQVRWKDELNEIDKAA